VVVTRVDTPKGAFEGLDCWQKKCWGRGIGDPLLSFVAYKVREKPVFGKSIAIYCVTRGNAAPRLDGPNRDFRSDF